MTPSYQTELHCWGTDVGIERGAATHDKQNLCRRKKKKSLPVSWLSVLSICCDWSWHWRKLQCHKQAHQQSLANGCHCRDVCLSNTLDAVTFFCDLTVLEFFRELRLRLKTSTHLPLCNLLNSALFSFNVFWHPARFASHGHAKVSLWEICHRAATWFMNNFPPMWNHHQFTFTSRIIS